MNNISLVCVKLLLFVSLLTPTMSMAQTTGANEAAYRNLLLQLIASLQQQITLLEMQLAEQNTIAQPAVSETGGSLSQIVDIVATYPVTKVADTSAVRDREQRAYFDRVFALFPTVYDQLIGRVVVFSGETSSFDAFVETVPPTHEKWLYAVNEDIIDEPLAKWNTELIVHELAHLVAYESVSNAAKKEYTCEAYFLRHGCPPDDSFLRLYVSNFWEATDLRRADRFIEAADDYESAYAYYDDHQTDFVSDYAAIGPEEDFAESFMYFMFDKPVSGRIAQEKVAFFGQYKKMIDIQNDINQMQ